MKRTAHNRKYPDFFICKECSVYIPNKTGHPRSFCSRKCHSSYSSKNHNRTVFKCGDKHWNYTKDRSKVIKRSKTIFTNKQQRLIAEKCDFICNICSFEFVIKKPFYKAKKIMSFDHIIPIRLNGEHSIDNGQLLCRSCNKIKTNADVKEIIKHRQANS